MIFKQYKTGSSRKSFASNPNALFKLTSLALLGAVLGGCATSQTKSSDNAPYQYQTQHSPALNLMLATGTMVEDGEIYDVELERPEKAGEDAIQTQNSRESWDNFLDGVGVIDAVMRQKGFWSPPLGGVSNDFHSGMMLLYLIDTPYKPSFLQPHIVALMPSEMANSKQEAAIKLESMLNAAVSKSLPEGYQYESFHHVWKPIFGSEEVSNIGVLTGGECDKSQVEFTGPGEQPIHEGCKLNFVAKRDPELINAPTWMKSEKVYLFHPDLYKDQNSSKGRIDYLMDVDAKEADGIVDSINARLEIEESLGDFAREKFLLKVTEHMPAWFYVYNAPTEEQPMPTIYQQGNILYFVKYAE